jgi:predicted  nucleic acid-binding Zn-ribbon protein
MTDKKARRADDRVDDYAAVAVALGYEADADVEGLVAAINDMHNRLAKLNDEAAALRKEVAELQKEKRWREATDAVTRWMNYKQLTSGLGDFERKKLIEAEDFDSALADFNKRMALIVG